MLDREGWVYVTDFGIAKQTEGAGLTHEGVIIGTPHYMSPEQFNGQPVTGAADQYALGVLAYELLTGRTPYVGPSIGEVMKGHLFETVPAMHVPHEAIPPSVEACVMRMLAKDPAERYASIAEAVAAFGALSATMEFETKSRIARLADEGARAQPQLSVPTSPVPTFRPTVHHSEAHAADTRPTLGR
jgi:serine/threonine-protein kinase